MGLGLSESTKDTEPPPLVGRLGQGPSSSPFPPHPQPLAWELGQVTTCGRFLAQKMHPSQPLPRIPALSLSAAITSFCSSSLSGCGPQGAAAFLQPGLRLAPHLLQR